MFSHDDYYNDFQKILHTVDQNDKTYSNKKFSVRQQISAILYSIYVFNSVFIEFKAVNSYIGGAINYNSNSKGVINIELSRFNKCNSDQNAGAIFSSNCNLIIYNVCCNNCFTGRNYEGQVVYANAYEDKFFFDLFIPIK